MASALRSLTPQVGLLAATARVPTPRLAQAAAEAARATVPAPRMAQVAVLAAYAPPSSQDSRSSQLQVLSADASPAANIKPRTSQAMLLIAYGTGVPITQTANSWTFVMDGHRFWVLSLGPEGDWAYDTTTKQWCQLTTQGYPGLNFTQGVMWNLRVMGGDVLDPYLYELDPDQPDDQGWRPVQHVVTGGLQTRSPNQIGVANFRLAGSAGVLSDATTDVLLEFSDDNGKTWTAMEPITVAQGDVSLPLVWSALGSFGAPGRIFRITDDGGMLSLFGADASLNNYDEDDTGGSGNGG